MVESLVAITLLLLSLAGPMTLVVQGLRASYYSSTQITAFYLAQDAVEYVRNVRDNNGLARRVSADPSSIPWLKGLENCTTNPDPENLSAQQKCIIDTTVLPSCGATGCTTTGAVSVSSGQYLKFDATGTGRYQHAVGSNSLYRREVQIVPITDVADGTITTPSGSVNSGDVLVIVTVTWQAQFFPSKTVKIKTNLYNWQS